MACPFAASGLNPTPPALPGRFVVGNALELIRTPFQCIADAATERGPVFRMRLFGLPVTVLSGPEAAAVVRMGASGPLARQGTFRAFSTQTAVDLFSLEGPAHAAARGLLQRGYSRQGFGQFLAPIARDLERRVRDLGTPATIEVADLCADLAVCGIAGAISPADLSSSVADVARFGKDVMQVIVGLRPSLIFLLPGFRKSKRRLEGVVDAAVERHSRGDFSGEERPAMIDAFLAARGEGSAKLEPRQVRGACLYALCGAYTYVGPLASFMLYEIVRDRALRTQVRAEVDEAFSEEPLDPLRFRQMSHLRAAYFESLRRYPSVLGLVFRARQAFDFARFRIPKGEMILVSPVPGHFDEQLYPKPFDFDYRRFHGGRQATGGAYAPFGMAPRICMAAGMVELLTMAVVAAVLRNAELALVRPSYEIRAELRPLPQPPDGLPMILRGLRDPPAAVRGALDAIDLTDPFADGPDALPALLDIDQEPTRLAQGEVVTAPRPGDGHVFVVLDGRLRTEESVPDEQGPEHLFKQGDVVGYGMRGTSAPRRYVVVRPCRILWLDATAFDAALGSTDLMVRELGRALEWRHTRSILARALPGVDLATLRSALPGLDIEHLGADAKVFRQGDAAHNVYIVLSGELSVIRELPDGSEHQVGTLKAGEPFGEIGVLHGRPRGATVRVNGSGAVVLALGHAAIDRLLADSPEAREGLALTAGQRLIAWIEGLEARATHELPPTPA